MGPDFSPSMLVKSLTSQQIVRIHQLFRQAKFDDPSGDVSFYIGVFSPCINFLQYKTFCNLFFIVVGFQSLFLIHVFILLYAF